jgi:hypothetical protein
MKGIEPTALCSDITTAQQAVIAVAASNGPPGRRRRQPVSSNPVSNRKLKAAVA